MLNQLLGYDGIVSRFLQKFWKCFILNLLFFLFSIPVLTIGTSFTAMYYAMEKNVMEERGHLFEAFWNGFKGNLKQSVLTQLIFVAVGLVFAQDIYFFYGQMKAGKSIGMLWILFALLMVLLVLTAIYTYSYMARIENTLGRTIKDAFLIMFLKPAQNLKIVILLVAGALLIFLMPPCIIFVPVLTTFLMHKGMEKTLRKYMRGAESEESGFGEQEGLSETVGDDAENDAKNLAETEERGK